MPKNIRTICALFLLFMLSALSPASNPAEPAPPDRERASEAGNRSTAFALDLYRAVAGETDGNLFLSPYSVSSVLSMTLAGVSGDTEKQMAALLDAPDDITAFHAGRAALEQRIRTIEAKGDVTLEVANSIWPQKGYPLAEPFLQDLKTYYGSTVTPVDYRTDTEKARKTINTWVEKKTRDKIRELLKPGILNTLTRLTLVNAIYFKGNWQEQFDAAETADADFFVDEKKTVTVSMMHQEGKFRYAALDGLQAVELSYAGDDFSMLVLLSAAREGIAGLEKRLTPELLDTLTGSLRKRTVSLFLPKFTVTSTLRLDSTLRALGMKDAFDPEKADFSRMTSRDDGLFIGAVVHKAFIDVGEEGTEAAAATGVIVGVTSVMPEPPVVFRADRPFLFLIRDNSTGAILFVGRVAKPANG